MYRILTSPDAFVGLSLVFLDLYGFYVSNSGEGKEKEKNKHHGD
jgi:hypothetical protein